LPGEVRRLAGLGAELLIDALKPLLVCNPAR
jgi:hypothetical protein